MKLITTAPNIDFSGLTKNLWFWLGVLGLVMLLYIAYINGKTSGEKNCKK